MSVVYKNTKIDLIKIFLNEQFIKDNRISELQKAKILKRRQIIKITALIIDS